MNLFVRTCNYGRMNVSRLVARGVAAVWIAVGALAVIGAFGGMGYSVDKADIPIYAIPLAIGLVILVVAFFFEVLAAVLSWVVAAVFLVWGFMAGWESAQWVAMLILAIVPMAIAGFLYFLASQTQKVCSLEEAG